MKVQEMRCNLQDQKTALADMPANPEGTVRSEAGQPDSLWDIRARLDENFRRVAALLEQMEREQEPRMRLAASAELRYHIALAQKTLEAASKEEAVRAFEDIVLAAIAESNTKVWRRVLERLRMRCVNERDEQAPAELCEQDGGEVRDTDSG
jgi:hypothetical protein